MDVMEKYVMQKVNRKEKSICPNCIHHNLCIAENNQPCFECNRFTDANCVTVQDWIPVTERMPDDGETVLTYKNGIIEVQMYEKMRNGWLSGNWFWSMATVTHWMPLPEPPKEDMK